VVTEDLVNDLFIPLLSQQVQQCSPSRNAAFNMLQICNIETKASKHQKTVGNWARK